MSDPIKEFTRRLEVTDEVEIAAFRWLQQVGAIPEHHKPESSNIRLGVYSKQKDAIQTEAITKGINPEMPFGVNTPDLFWAHIHAFVVDWHREKMPPLCKGLIGLLDLRPAESDASTGLGVNYSQ